jgi:hypothetical protein
MNPSLTDKDVRSTSMGAPGEDVQLSEAAFSLVPFHIEAKNLARIAVYKYYEQPKTKNNVLVIVKGNRKKPLAILDAELFFTIIRELNDLKTNKVPK